MTSTGPTSAVRRTAWAGTALLPYGVLTAVLALSGEDDHPGPTLTGWIVVAAVIAFCGAGSALGVCAWSYQRRSKPAGPRRG
ncbi:hypothetical protein ABZ897_27235 [Nonomuraea sp. NPDC046802]|uniref:hypothetical protein n=1 Tax=Nonomuraea sp. NPDC046802 TaxID=3154919 RepID=UPI0033FD3315